jgi:hypothetical protein
MTTPVLQQPGQAQPPPPQQESDLLEIAEILAVATTAAAAASALHHLLPKASPQWVLQVVQLVQEWPVVPVSAIGPATREISTLNQVRRAAYLEKAVQRGEQARTAAVSHNESLDEALEQALTDEQQYHRMHVEAVEKRIQAAGAVDAASLVYGNLLGWYSTLDTKCTPECEAANGKNFYASKPPIIGWPGTTHPKCRCQPGKPFKGAMILPTAGISLSRRDTRKFILELASKDDHHIPGTPDTYRHGWIPVAGAGSYKDLHSLVDASQHPDKAAAHASIEQAAKAEQAGKYLRAGVHIRDVKIALKKSGDHDKASSFDEAQKKLSAAGGYGKAEKAPKPEPEVKHIPEPLPEPEPPKAPAAPELSGTFDDALSPADAVKLRTLIKDLSLSFKDGTHGRESGGQVADDLDDLKKQSITGMLEKAGLPPETALAIPGFQIKKSGSMYTSDPAKYALAYGNRDSLSSDMMFWSGSGGSPADELSKKYDQGMAMTSPPEARASDFTHELKRQGGDTPADPAERVKAYQALHAEVEKIPGADKEKAHTILEKAEGFEKAAEAGDETKWSDARTAMSRAMHAATGKYWIPPEDGSPFAKRYEAVAGHANASSPTFHWMDESPEAAARRAQVHAYWKPRAQKWYTGNVMQETNPKGTSSTFRYVSGTYANEINHANLQGQPWAAQSRTLSSWADSKGRSSAKSFVKKAYGDKNVIELQQKVPNDQVYATWRGEGILRNGVKAKGEVIRIKSEVNSGNTTVTAP